MPEVATVELQQKTGWKISIKYNSNREYLWQGSNYLFFCDNKFIHIC